MIVGDRTPGPSVVELVANTKVVARFAVPQAGLLGKVAAFLDGFGSGGPGTAKVKGVIYRQTGELVAVSDEATVATDALAAWVDLPFSAPGGCVLDTVGGNFDIGLLVGGDTNVARMFVESSTLGGRQNANTYVSGPSDPFGGSSPLTTDIGVYGIAVASFVPADLAGEFYYARMPFPEAQQKFQETAPVRNTATPALLAWHGTSLDPERGAFAVVKPGGLFDDWIGERIRITTRLDKAQPIKSAVCFVHNYGDIPTDLSVPRRVWAELAPLGLDTLRVTVEKMG